MNYNEQHQAMSNSAMDNVLATDLLVSVSVFAEVNKVKISNLAFAASEELQQMAMEGEPLWVFDEIQDSEVLNSVEYKRRFISLDETLEEVIRVIKTGGSIMGMSYQDSTRSGKISRLTAENETTNVLQTEASRAIAVVYADPIRLIHMLMNVDQWSEVFSNIISKASSLGFLSTADLGSPDGVLQVVKAEFHVPSPLVRTWEFCFARYCRELAVNTWLVTDVSLESIFPNLALGGQRRPSGCLIQGLHEGISKVTWVENNAVDTSLIHNMFRLIITPGFAFSASRWIATLVRQYDQKAYVDQQFYQFAEPKDDSGNADFMNRRFMAFPQPEQRLAGTGRNSLLKLAARMVRSYTANVTSCSENLWRPLPITGAEDILVKTSFNMDNPGIPQGVAVTIATSVRLPFPQVDVFNFLSDSYNRSKWDMLSHGTVTRDIERFSSGRDPSNWISVVLAEPAAKKTAMLYLQESFTDSTGLYVVHAPIDMAAMDHIVAGKNTDVVAILPCGFVILPDTGESILTIAFQIMDEEVSASEYLPPKSVLTAHNIIMTTVDLIKDGLSSISK